MDDGAGYLVSMVQLLSMDRLRQIIKEEIADMQGHDVIDEKEDLFGLYSDMFKDRHGVRPRISHAEWDELTVADLEEMIEGLGPLSDYEDDYDIPDYEDDFERHAPYDAEALDDEDEVWSDAALPKHQGMGVGHYPKTRFHGPNINKH